MLAITCEKCRRRYTATDEELRVYLREAEGKKFAPVLCPHCGKASKVSADRIHQALRFSTPPADAPAPGHDESRAAETAAGDAAPAAGASAGLGGPPTAGEVAASGSLPEEENPPA